MNKWTFRLIGLVVVVAISTLLFRSWFFPKQIPPALQTEIPLQMTHHSLPEPEETELPITSNDLPVEKVEFQPEPEPVLPAAGDKPPAPPITLISYEEGEKKEESEAPQRPIPLPPQPTEIVEKAPLPQPIVAEKPEPIAEVVEKVAEKPAPRPEPKRTVAVERAKPTPRGGNWVQAGAFSSQENTRNFVARLKRKSWPVTTEDAVVNGKLVHRVLIGPLSPADVEEYINILGKMGFNARQVSR